MNLTTRAAIDTLPCPFCGTRALAETNFGQDWWVQCENNHDNGQMYDSKEEAVYGWNQRAPTALAQPSVLIPEEPPAAALGILIGYDSLEHLNDCDQEVLRNRARMRWAALREACKAPAPGAATS